MEKTFYRMEKAAWDCRTGMYSAVAKVTGNLTLAQVRTRVARLPDTTICDWTITMYHRDEESEGSERIIGSEAAEEFNGDVPEF